ncbi:MAG: O-antigen ligase family protein [Halothermotrichaceae bacterium]
MKKAAVWTDKVLEFLFFGLIILTPISTALSNILIGLLFIIFLLKIIFFRDINYKTDLNKYILMFFLLSILSIIKAADINYSIKSLVNPLLKISVFYFIAYDLINYDKLKKVYKALIISGVLAFSYGAYIDYFTTDNFYNHNNSNGTFAAVMTIFFLTYILYKENNIYKRILFTILSLGGFALVTSYSRGASLAFAIGIFIWFIMYFIKYKNIKFITIILIIFILLSVFVVPEELYDRFKKIENIEDNSSLKTRVVMWHASLLMIRDNPLLGVGIGNFNSNFNYYIDNVMEANIVPGDRSQYHPHNIYLYIASEQGIPSLVILLVLLIKLFIIGYKNYQKNHDWNLITAMGLIMIAVNTIVAVHSMVDTTFRHNKVSFYVIVFTVINLKIYNQHWMETDSQKEKGVLDA